MNIVHVLFSFRTGGIENLLVDLMNNWNTQDKLMLCIINDSRDLSLLSRIKKDETKRVICLERPAGGGKVKYIKKLNRILHDFQADVVHCHSNNAFKFCLPLKILHNKARYILTVHDTNLYSRYKRIDCIFHKLFLYRIFAISEAVQKEIHDRGWKQAELVYNGVDVRKFEALPRRPNQLKTIICVARLQPEKKGQDILIQAIAELKEKRQDFQCWLAGEAPLEEPGSLHELERQVEVLQLERYVTFLGNRSDVPELLAQSDIFVLPSRYEGFGISIIEAMLAGAAVVASDLDGPKEIIRNNQYGYLFERGNSSQLSEILNQLLDAPDEEKTQRAYRYAVDRFNIETVIGKMRKLYE